ncbi:TATA-box-binding protein [Salinigranum halophilum]|uniref:TATA-box-binding protein n=1 Tax=Salinigranum halophilum TaxID=2565931 RepID=UPI0010A85CBC|nr:TATA-box-binding protein [Salinigranum halophilum]
MVDIANVVGSGDLGAEIDLQNLGADLEVPFTEYNPSNYHGLYARLEEDGPLITVYRSGKYIISGCSSVEGLERVNEQFLVKIASLGIVERNYETGFTVQNVVCTATLDRQVDLNALSIGLGLESTEYEPEQFPGLVYRPEAVPGVLLVFANGKCVITGCRDLDTATEAFSHLQDRASTLFE